MGFVLCSGDDVTSVFLSIYLFDRYLTSACCGWWGHTISQTLSCLHRDDGLCAGPEREQVLTESNTPVSVTATVKGAGSETGTPACKSPSNPWQLLTSGVRLDLLWQHGKLTTPLPRWQDDHGPSAGSPAEVGMACTAC